MSSIKEKPTGITGEYVIETYDATPIWYRYLPDKLKAWINKNFRKPLRVSSEMKNLVMDDTNTGIQLICKGFTGSRTNIKLTYARVGTDGTARTDTDSDLNSPFATYFPITFYNNNGSSVTLEIFMSDQKLDDGTYEEVGLYMDTTSNPKFFSASVISPAESKVTGEDKQINYTVSVTN